MNYLTNDTELTAVANAIREKCDTSDSLEWPNGFIQAIEDCETGGPELKWLWGNQITNTLSGTIDSTDDAYKGPILNLDVDGVSTQITTTGKNLLDTTIWTEGYYFNDSGTPSSYATSHYSENYSPVSAGSYTLNVHRGTVTDNVRLHGYDANKQWVKQIYIEQYAAGSGWYAKTNIVIDEDIKYVRLSCTKSITEIMLESGASTPDTSYEPYTGGKVSPHPDYPQPILSVSGLGLVLVKKNLFDVDNATFANGYYYDNRYNGSYFSSIYARMITTYTPIVGDATYTLSYSKDDTNQISCGIMFYDKDKVYVSGTTFAITSPVGEKSVTFTTPSNARYIKFHLSLNSSNIQLELGSTATAYEPYVGTTISLYDGTLRSLPDGTKDQLHLAYLRPSKREGWAWYSRELVERTKEMTLDGSVTNIAVSVQSSATPAYVKVLYPATAISDCIAHTGNSSKQAIMCTELQSGTWDEIFTNSSWPSGITKFPSTGYGPCLKLSDMELNTVALVNAWLSENPLHIIYGTTNPITTTLDPIELPIMPSENATVWCDGGSAQPTFMLEYIQDANIVISRLEDSIADLATS